MSERSVTQDTFVIERTYGASPARVFRAWSEPAAKARWFAGAEAPGNGYSTSGWAGAKPTGAGPRTGPSTC